ncbi:MarR family transcriptional regulator [Citrobacter amalonaticus]|uniref:MarR family transcriptional regulator n=1 Tax=Citrobacter amalonaticus TaxID=35703 RepID=A0A2S4S2G6_CITAM|nr:MarR family winged helix-turn-helix transcriptional regulator [Citrobacter amalonaticus]POT59476.1 MarR family transcriptional regulator [Citrobacter amalonaticus]POT77606.1 MarR family transcriptional regulator [Citrobacter amalonaticus]POU68058.1 MarR family transcriptional regulator [Citrobacter amalonaticus]POV07662.1 MarR family transcriptional regulator [Citrobacter amalonaticus]
MTLFDILERLVTLQMRAMQEHPQLKGLPGIWVQILHYLAQCNGYSNTPIATAEYLGLTKGTVSQSLSKLESEGWIRKESDIRDKRVVHLVLTPHAADIMREVKPGNQMDVLRGLPFPEAELRDGFLDALRQLQKCKGVRMFGECRFCRFHQHQDGQPWCGLTKEPIPVENITLICREFEEPDSGPTRLSHPA